MEKEEIKELKENVKEVVNRHVFILHEAAESGKLINLDPFREEIQNNIGDFDESFKGLDFSFTTKLGNKISINIGKSTFVYEVYSISESKLKHAKVKA